jgi:hypothetical protein
MDLEAIAARLAKASAGPWRRHGADVFAADSSGTPILVGRDGSPELRGQSDADAEFVAHARSDLEELVGARDQAGGHDQPGASAWEYKFVTHSERGETDSELNAAGAQGWKFVAVIPEKAGHVLLLLERSHV